MTSYACGLADCDCSAVSFPKRVAATDHSGLMCFWSCSFVSSSGIHLRYASRPCCVHISVNRRCSTQKVGKKSQKKPGKGRKRQDERTMYSPYLTVFLLIQYRTHNNQTPFFPKPVQSTSHPVAQTHPSRPTPLSRPRIPNHHQRPC